MNENARTPSNRSDATRRWPAAASALAATVLGMLTCRAALVGAVNQLPTIEPPAGEGMSSTARFALLIAPFFLGSLVVAAAFFVIEAGARFRQPRDGPGSTSSSKATANKEASRDFGLLTILVVGAGIPAVIGAFIGTLLSKPNYGEWNISDAVPDATIGATLGFSLGLLFAIPAAGLVWIVRRRDRRSR